MYVILRILIDVRVWAIIAVLSLLIPSLIHYRAVHAVMIEKCFGENCEAVCDGSLSTPLGELEKYRVHCKEDIFKDGFE